MRNLKRVLSLALASVMLLGMMVIGAGAADKVSYDKLTDKDKVTNKEAVSLMVDLGIIVGKPDGSFAPAEVVDRATMAKLITYIQMGDVDQSIFKGTKTDLKDVDGTWAEGYIKYCYANGVITGDGIGHFFPTQSVSVVAAAKMLLVALGYDPNGSGYVNDSMWSVNIMKDAQSAGLLNGISQKSTDGLTRDNAALMVFNALMAKTVKANYAYDMGVKYLTGYTSGTTLGANNYKLGVIKATVTGINTDGTAITTATGEYVSLNGYLTGKLAGTPSLIGSGVVAYYNTSTNKLISTSLFVGGSTVLATSYNGTKLANLTTKGDSKYLASLDTDPAATYYVNGVSKTATEANDAIAIGSVVEFVDNDKDGTADVVRVTNKTVVTLAAAPVVGKNTAGDAVVTVSSITGLTKILATKVMGYENLAKGDVVLYVKLGDTYYLEKAASVSGVVNGLHSTKGILLDGTYYLTAGLTGAANDWSADYTNTYTFYLDNGKNIIKATKDTSATAANYAVLVDAAWVQGSGVEGTNYIEAKLLFVDGTTQVVKIASVNGIKPVATTYLPATGTVFSMGTNGASAENTDWKKGTGLIPVTNNNGATYIYTLTGTSGSYALDPDYITVGSSADLTAATKSLTTNKTNITSHNTGDESAPFMVKGSFYSFTKNSAGAYLLSTAANGTDTYGTVASTITTGSTAVGNAVGNSSTVFLYAVKASDGTVSYKVYTGIANAPKAASVATTDGSIVKNNSGFATLVYVAAASSDVSGAFSKDLIYITSSAFTTKVVSGVTYYTQNAIVNGEAKTVDLTATKAVGMYTVSDATTAGYLTLTDTLGSGVANKTGVKGNSGNTLVTGDDTAYTYTADTKVFYIDTDGASTAMSADAIQKDANDALYIVKNATVATKADTIYVVQVKATEPTAVTLAAGTTKGVTTLGSLTDIKAGTATITKWIAASANTIKVTATADTYYTVQSIAINGVVTAGATVDNYALTTATAHSLTVIVTVADNFSGALEAYTYTIAIPAASAS